MAGIADDGALTLRPRMPDCLVTRQGKYLTIAGVRFSYGHQQALAALHGNTDYGHCRREHGDASARASELGQAISYRLKRNRKGWRVFATTEMMDLPVVTVQRSARLSPAACLPRPPRSIKRTRSQPFR